MALKFQLLHVVLSCFIRLTSQSIAGVSYMDHFDFEQRYRNPYECDPFHWYPLHLPPNCAKMYQELIHKGITSLTNSPVRIMKERESISYNVYPSLLYSSYNLNPSDVYFPSAYETDNSQEMYEMTPLTPYMKMFQMLRQDVMREPSAPLLTNIPGLGVAALYKQPISRKSGQYIKKIAGIYRDANYEFKYDQYETTTKNPDPRNSHEKNSINQNKHFDIKKKIENGNLLTMLRTIKN